LRPNTQGLYPLVRADGQETINQHHWWGEIRRAQGTVRVFRQEFALKDAIGSHASSLQANMHVINGIPLRSPLLLPVGTVNRVQTLKATISMQDVSFAYPARPDQQVLEGVTLEVPEGSVVALVGPSGGGKSTIVSLIERLYDVDSGSIRIGGEAVKALDPVWLHQKMTIVSQEPDLFACSILDNIKYGMPEATEEEVIAAAKAANAHEFISKFQEGYGTMVGERGIRLSGGQKQRVWCARFNRTFHSRMPLVPCACSLKALPCVRLMEFFSTMCD
jgi:ABC-type multidrug transport system fused ATPase/permease subunit